MGLFFPRKRGVGGKGGCFFAGGISPDWGAGQFGMGGPPGAGWTFFFGGPDKTRGGQWGGGKGPILGSFFSTHGGPHFGLSVDFFCGRGRGGRRGGGHGLNPRLFFSRGNFASLGGGPQGGIFAGIRFFGLCGKKFSLGPEGGGGAEKKGGGGGALGKKNWGDRFGGPGFFFFPAKKLGGGRGGGPFLGAAEFRGSKGTTGIAPKIRNGGGKFLGAIFFFFGQTRTRAQPPFKKKQILGAGVGVFRQKQVSKNKVRRGGTQGPTPEKKPSIVFEGGGGGSEKTHCFVCFRGGRKPFPNPFGGVKGGGGILIFFFFFRGGPSKGGGGGGGGRGGGGTGGGLVGGPRRVFMVPKNGKHL